MSDIHDACIGLANAVKQVPGLDALPYLADQINPPVAHVFNRQFDPRFTLGNSPNRVVALGLRVYVRRSPTDEAQRLMREYMTQDGPYSIIAAVENEGYWDGEVHDVEVTQVGQPFEVAIDGGSVGFLAVDFDVEVII